MKYVAALQRRLRHLARPVMFRATGPASTAADGVSIGQRLAERVAAAVGSWVFIGAQAAAMALWVLVNTLTLTGALHFDQYPFVFLNLAMSAEAAFTGPILLIAANVGALRDHAQADRIEQLTGESEKLTAQNRDLVERILTLEQVLDEHVGQSLRAHTAELHDLSALVRAVHAAVVPLSGADLVNAGSSASADTPAVGATVPSDVGDSTEAPQPGARARPRQDPSAE